MQSNWIFPVGILLDVNENILLYFEDISYDVGFELIKWVYTDEIGEQQNEDFLLNLMKTGKRFELKELIDQFVSIENSDRMKFFHLDVKQHYYPRLTFEIV